MIYFPAVNTSNKEFEDKLKAFYETEEWINLRNAFRSKMTQFCCVCGSEKRLNVDHINPIRFFWEQRLDENNLQILCNECNLEKGYSIGWTLEWHISKKEGYKRKREWDEYWKSVYGSRSVSNLNKNKHSKIICKSKDSKTIRIIKKDGTVIERDA